MDKYFMVHGSVCYQDANQHIIALSNDDICKALNENDGRKNQPRIDKNIKDEIISLLDNQANILLEIEPRGDISNYTTAIEIISSLPTEEN